MKVVTAVVNNPDFIKIQNFTLKKQMQCPYEFIVFNDAKKFPDFTNFNDITIASEIEKVCKELNIKCINVPNDHHKNVPYSVRAGDSMNYILRYELENLDSYLCLDSDMFLIDNFHEEEFKNYDAAVVQQSRNVKSKEINYIWNGLQFMNFHKLQFTEKMDWGLFGGVDTGGKMNEWLHAYDREKILGIPLFHSNCWGPQNFSSLPAINKKLREFLIQDERNKSENSFFSELQMSKFFHYRAGGNWQQLDRQLHKSLTTRLLRALTDEI